MSSRFLTASCLPRFAPALTMTGETLANNKPPQITFTLHDWITTPLTSTTMSLFLMNSAVFGDKFKETDRMKHARSKHTTQSEQTNRTDRRNNSQPTRKCKLEQSVTDRKTADDALSDTKTGLDTEQHQAFSATNYEQDLIQRYYGGNAEPVSTPRPGNYSPLHSPSQTPPGIYYS